MPERNNRVNQALRIRAKIAAQRIKERLLLDSPIFRTVLGTALYILAIGLLLSNKKLKGTELLATVHRAEFTQVTSRWVESLFRTALRQPSGLLTDRISEAILQYPERISEHPNAQRLDRNPELLFKGFGIVLKSPSPSGAKGIIYLYYSYLYPVYIKHYNWQEISKKYHVVVEPSWSGYCDLNILCLHRIGSPIFIGCYEPRDWKFLEHVAPNFRPVSFAGNTWIDDAKFRPDHSARKIYDLVCISGWADYKRHWALFQAIASSKKQGLTLRVALIGYAIEYEKASIRELADHFGINDCITFFEGITHEQVVKILQQSKINVLWSRKEGSNRGIIEGLFVDVPLILRRNHNYGHPYHYVNEQTGTFADEHDFPEKVRSLLRRTATLHPRDYVMKRMTAAASTQLLHQAISDYAKEMHEPWDGTIEIKVSTLDGLSYMDEAKAQHFEADRLYLTSMLCRNYSATA